MEGHASTESTPTSVSVYRDTREPIVSTGSTHVTRHHVSMERRAPIRTTCHLPAIALPALLNLPVT